MAAGAWLVETAVLSVELISQFYFAHEKMASMTWTRGRSQPATARRLLVSILPVCLLAGLCAYPSRAQTATITVDASTDLGPLPPIWNYFGYDEPNFTYSPNGKKLLRELAQMNAASRTPVYIRTHNLLTTGNGEGSLKWGSTNAYTEDTAGNPVYSWTIIDRIFDTYKEAGVKPLVELGFMTEAMSTHPEPYRHSFPNGNVFTGWSYPPKDYEKWAALVNAFASHLRQRYGDAEVHTWLWEVWNEPDIPYWHGTAEGYFKLYDYSADAVLRAVPGAKVGGPESTGPANDKAAGFLSSFLEHCARGKNAATGATGAPLSFISFHPKGSPKMIDGHVRMGIANQLNAIDRGFKIVAGFPEWRHTPIILGESDPEGCAACTAKQNPQNAYRNGPLFPTYTAVVLKGIHDLAKRDGVNFQAAVTWSFQFDNQPYFEGLRELATNGIDKPVLNAFRMFGMMGPERVALESSGAEPLADIQSSGVVGKPDIDGLAARRAREIDVLVWNYHDDDVPAPAAQVELRVKGIGAKKVTVRHYRIDQDHSNSFTAWQQMGSPQRPTPAQYAQLEKAGQLQLLSPAATQSTKAGQLDMQFPLPRQALSLVRISW
jgi:xylan 1,4-beta-xylosidase